MKMMSKYYKNEVKKHLKYLCGSIGVCTYHFKRKKTKIEKYLKTLRSLKLQKLRFHMKNKLKTRKIGEN